MEKTELSNSNFTPSFKEKENEQFYFEDGKWVICGENIIALKWKVWVSAKNAKQFNDEEGFLVFGYVSE